MKCENVQVNVSLSRIFRPGGAGKASPETPFLSAFLSVQIANLAIFDYH
jgi:hypothetical protein